MGPEGLKRVNDLCWQNSHYLFDQLLATGKFEQVYDGDFIKEFVLMPLCDVKKLQKALDDYYAEVIMLESKNAKKD